MASISDLKRGNSLVWVTERPFQDASRRSSNFWLLDSEYYLQFSSGLCGYNDACYNLSLHSGNQLSLDLNVVTFIRTKYTDFSIFAVINLKGAEKVILTKLKTKVDKALGLTESYAEVTITCVFTSDRPLTVRLSGSETVHLTTQTDFECPSKLTSDMESLSDDLSSLLEQELCPDVQLTCEDRSFPAHRSILTARSEVFAAMFRNKMAESETGTVDVTDMDAEALDVLLKYVYSGKLPELSCDAASILYAASDKYRILALRQACSELMVGWLTPENCLSSLVLADAHSDEDFKDRVVDFVVQNLELVKKEAWSLFNKEHPGLAISVYQKRFATALPKQD